MLGDIFPTFAAIARKVNRAIANRNAAAQRQVDLDFELRTDALINALYHCGIPLHVAQRNARAFMVLRPDFDLNSPKYRRLKGLIEHHQDEFLDAYYEIARSHGKTAADNWIKWIRENDVFFARICQLPDDFAVRYLFA